jgi:uncharacterized protein (TIGR00255 family)
MIRSMTGWGEAEIDTDVGRLRVEIRTVNHRFLNTSIRLPSGHDRLEAAVVDWIKPRLLRGHVTLGASIERDDPSDRGLAELDLDRARHAYELYRELGHALGLIGEVDVATIARFPDVIRPPDPRRGSGAGAIEVPEEALREAVALAVDAVVTFREREGEALRTDLEGRLDELEAALDSVEARAPQRLLAERDRLREKIGELIESHEVDDERLAREVAWLAEKWDINEEIVRFRGHVALMRETLDADGSESVGKRLSFIVQEMHREANTIGSKANDTDIGHAAVKMKEEVERLREQVENVE